MQSRVDEVAADVYRISTFNPDFGIQFNQFLIKDDEPFLMHTGLRRMFPATLEGIRAVIDPARLRWIGFSHFESDECGALNDLLVIAPQAQAVCSFVGAMVSVNDFAERPARALADGEVLPTGRRRLRYLATPHLPHGWDAGFFFEETERTFLCSDLFFQPGDPQPATEADVVGPAKEAMVQGQAGPLAHDMPYTPYTDATMRRLAELEPRTLALMHGSTYRGDGRRALLELTEVIRDTIGKPRS